MHNQYELQNFSSGQQASGMHHQTAGYHNHPHVNGTHQQTGAQDGYFFPPASGQNFYDYGSFQSVGAMAPQGQGTSAPRPSNYPDLLEPLPSFRPTYDPSAPPTVPSAPSAVPSAPQESARSTVVLPDQDVAKIKKQLLKSYRTEIATLKRRYKGLTRKLDESETALINAMISTSNSDIQVFMQKASHINQFLTDCEKYRYWMIAGMCVSIAVMLGSFVPLMVSLSATYAMIAVTGFCVGYAGTLIFSSTDSIHYGSTEASRYRQSEQDTNQFLTPYTQIANNGFFADSKAQVGASSPSNPINGDLPRPPSYQEATKGQPKNAYW